MHSCILYAESCCSKMSHAQRRWHPCGGSILASGYLARVDSVFWFSCYLHPLLTRLRWLKDSRSSILFACVTVIVNQRTFRTGPRLPSNFQMRRMRIILSVSHSVRASAEMCFRIMMWATFVGAAAALLLVSKLNLPAKARPKSNAMRR